MESVARSKLFIIMLCFVLVLGGALGLTIAYGTGLLGLLEKPALASVLADFESNMSAPRKSQTSADVEFVYYNKQLAQEGEDGKKRPKAEKIGQHVDVTRIFSDDGVYLAGNIFTTAFADSFAGMLNTILQIASGNSEASIELPQEIQTYIDPSQGAKLYGEVGYKKGANGEYGTINARGDFLEKDAALDFKFPYNGHEIPIFTALRDIDVLQFMRDIEFLDQDEDFNIEKTLMTPFILPFDWSSIEDLSEGKYAKGEGYEYSFNPSMDYVKTFVFDMVEKMLDETFSDRNNPESENYQEEKEDYEFLSQFFEKYKETIFKWFDFDINVKIAVDSNGRIVKIDNSFDVNIRIKIKDVVDMAGDLGINTVMVEGILTTVVFVVSNANGSRLYFEFDVSVSMTEEIEYDDVSVPTDSDVFKPYSEEYTDRFLLHYEVDEESGEREWTTSGYDWSKPFPPRER